MCIRYGHVFQLSISIPYHVYNSVFLPQYTKDRLYYSTAMFNNLSKGDGREAVTLIIQNICKLGQNKCFNIFTFDEWSQ